MIDQLANGQQRRDLDEATKRVRQVWEKLAPAYDRRIRIAEALLLGDGRRWVCSQASGRVLDVAVGTGRNFPLYPPHLEVTGMDLSPAMLARARELAARLGRHVTLTEGDAQALPFPDASFDTVVCTLSLCTIPDDRAAVGEMYRVLRAGGRLLLLDHVQSPSRFGQVIQRFLDRTVGRRHGEAYSRRPLHHVIAFGFEIEQRQRYKRGLVERLAARKPALNA